MKRTLFERLGLLVCALGLAACATSSSPGEGTPDPLRPINRPIFSFNETFDKYLFGPVAKGYNFITPEIFRDMLKNFFQNTATPVRFVAALGQGEPEAAGIILARLMVNSTFGLAGFFDVAAESGLPRYEEDIGKMFARWGIPSGPYLMIPILGPTTPRDGIGTAMAVAMNPLFWFAPVGATTIFAINERARADDLIDTARRNALDYYVFIRDAYTAHRQSVVQHRGPADFRLGGWQFLSEQDYDEGLYEFEDEGGIEEEERVPGL